MPAQRKEMTDEQKKALTERLEKARLKGQATRLRKKMRKSRARAMARASESIVVRKVTHDLASKQAISDRDQLSEKRNATAIAAVVAMFTPPGMHITVSRRAVEKIRQIAQDHAQAYGAAALEFTAAAKRQGTREEDFKRAATVTRIFKRWRIIPTQPLKAIEQ